MIADKLSPGDTFKNNLGELVVVENVIDEVSYVICRLRRKSGIYSGCAYQKIFFTSKGKVDLERATNYKSYSPKKP